MCYYKWEMLVELYSTRKVIPKPSECPLNLFLEFMPPSQLQLFL